MLLNSFNILSFLYERAPDSSEILIGLNMVNVENLLSNRLTVIAPEIFFIFWITIIWCYLAVKGKSSVALSGLRASLIVVLLLYICALLWQTNIGDINSIGINNSPFVLYSKILIVLFAIPVLWLTNLNINLALYFGAILLFNLGLIGSADMLSTYVCLEGLSLLSYGIIATNKTTGSAEAGLKYFLYGIVASALLIFGLSLLYIQSKDLSWNDTYLQLAYQGGDFSSEIQLLSVLLVFAALIYKLSLFPFHFTLPDVYEGSSWHTIAVINLGVKFGVALFLFRLWGIIVINVTLSESMAIILSWFAILSIIIGCFGAMVQTSLKRFLAYTSINQSGFIIMGLLTNSVLGLESTLLYLIVYMVSMLLFFYSVGGVTSDSLAEVNNITGISRLGLITALFSMAGIPPLFGFGSKYIVWLSLLDSLSSGVLSQSHYQHILFLLVVSVIISLISAFYYLRLIKVTSFTDGQPSIDTTASVIISVILLLFLSIWPLFIGMLLEGLNNYAIYNYGVWVAFY